MGQPFPPPFIAIMEKKLNRGRDKEKGLKVIQDWEGDRHSLFHEFSKAVQALAKIHPAGGCGLIFLSLEWHGSLGRKEKQFPSCMQIPLWSSSPLSPQEPRIHPHSPTLKK